MIKLVFEELRTGLTGIILVMKEGFMRWIWKAIQRISLIVFFFFYHFSKDLLQVLGVLYPDLITLLLWTGCTCGNRTLDDRMNIVWHDQRM